MSTAKPQKSHNRITDESIDFRRYVSLFISNWYWFAITLFLTISIAYGKNRWSEKVYTVSATLLIKDYQFGGENTGLSNIFPGAEAYKSQQNLKNEIGILKSFSLNKRVMDSLPEFHIVYVIIGKRGITEQRIYKQSPFFVVYDSLIDNNLGRKVNIEILSHEKYKLTINNQSNTSDTLEFGQRFTNHGFDFEIHLRDSAGYKFDKEARNKYYFYFTSPDVLASQYSNKLSVTPIETDASLVTLRTTGVVPEQEADYLNMLMEVYKSWGLDIKNETADQTILFIEKQLNVIADSLKNAERDLESFRNINKLLDISREGLKIQSQLERIQDEQANLRVQKQYYEYLIEYIESKNNSSEIISPSFMGVTDQLLIDLVKELSMLQQQKKQFGLALNEESGPIKILESNIETTIAAISNNINDGLAIIKKQEEDISDRLLLVEREISKLPSTEGRLINIQRKFDLNNTIYTYLLEKRAEAGIARASTVSDNRIIDYAGPFQTSRIKPRTQQNTLTALMLGLIIPVICILLLDLLNNKVLDKKDVEKGTNAPIVGYISHNSYETEIPVVEKPSSTLSESFRSVRTNLRYFIRDVKSPVISVSSTISTEGKTFISVNLAAILATLGKKVLLIGLDLRKPRIHKILDTDNENGMSYYLCGLKKFDEVIYNTQIENLFYAPAGHIPPNPAELIESDLMKTFINQAKNIYDFIIIDTPPIAIVTDALLVSNLTDLYLFVVRQRYSSKNTLGLIEEIYNHDSIKNMGIIMNDISLTGYYGYGLRYGYAPGYGYTYGYNYYGDYVSSKYGYSDTTGNYYQNKD